MKLHTRYGFSSILLENMLFLETSSVENKETCTLLGSWFGVFIQFALGLISFLTLLVKLHNEKPRRPFGVWARDSSKQAFGALLAHGFNILFAGLLTVGTQNPCVFYFVNFAVDTVFGLILNYVFLITFDALAATMGWTWFQSGNYGYPPRWAIWAAQFIEWLVIVTVVKFILLYALVVPFRMPFYDAGVWLMQPFENYPKVELVVVMVIIPFVLNTIVFWIQDNILMDRTHSPDIMHGGDTYAYFSSFSSKSKPHPFIDHYTQSNPTAQRTVLSKVGTNPMKKPKKWYQLFETTPEEEAEYYHYHGEPQFPYPRQSKNGERGTMISDHDIEHPSSDDDKYEKKYEQSQEQHIVTIPSQPMESTTSSTTNESPNKTSSVKKKVKKVKKVKKMKKTDVTTPVTTTSRPKPSSTSSELSKSV